MEATSTPPTKGSSLSPPAHLELPPIPVEDDLNELYAAKVEEVVADEEFAAQLRDPEVGVGADDLRAHLEANKREVWASVAAERTDDVVASRLVARSRTRQLAAGVVAAAGLLAIAGVFATVAVTGGPTSTLVIVAAAAAVGILIQLVFYRRTTRRPRRETRAAADVARRTLAERLYEEALKPVARELFPNERWTLQMGHAPAPGLAELTSTRFEVSTVSRDHLRDLMKALRGGAIGVSGPRGAGKTTLIDSVCNGRTKVVDGPHIGIPVSAPVHYDPRDFAIHLLTRACEAAIANPRVLQFERSKVFRDLSALERRRRATLFGVVGAVLATAAALSALGVDVTKGDERTIFLAALAGLCGLSAYVTWMSNALRQIPSTAWAREPKFEGGPFARWFQNLSWRTAQRLRPKGEGGGDTVAERAHELYRESKFQQSYSSGWSGSLKLPMGIGLGGDSKMSWAQVQMSLPELVEQLREFLEFMHTQRDVPVIVGIDELDKIGSKEDARTFLNGIKAVFGVPGVYFLVSVSQDAMSSFERRGLPFRDVFDSSFDEIVEARYLTLTETERLLRRRIIGMPTSFHALCHCLSGGLPRDVVRVARIVVEELEESQDLPEVATALVGAEVRAKCHATGIAAKNAPTQAGREDLLGYVASIEALEVSAATLYGACSTFPTTDAAELERPLDPAATGSSLADLAHELNAFGYYCATLLDLFGDGVTEARLADAAEHSDFERLAEARQGFAIDHTVAWRRLSKLRERPAFGPGLAQPAVPAATPPPLALAMSSGAGNGLSDT